MGIGHGCWGNFNDYEFIFIFLEIDNHITLTKILTKKNVKNEIGTIEKYHCFGQN